jgi:hypothetical protein
MTKGFLARSKFALEVVRVTNGDYEGPQDGDH